MSVVHDQGHSTLRLSLKQTIISNSQPQKAGQRGGRMMDMARKEACAAIPLLESMSAPLADYELARD
jgi:hypothetical protein